MGDNIPYIPQEIMETEFIYRTDSYKMSHPYQLRAGTQATNAYGEARYGTQELVYEGMQPYLQDYLGKKLDTLSNISVDGARAFCAKHGVPFKWESWQKLAKRIKEGRGLPVEIYSVDEGTVLPCGNVLWQIRNTTAEAEEHYPWLPTWLETQILRASWYPSTVATKSREMKTIIAFWLEKSSDNMDMLNWMLQDFGARGVNCGEGAGIGGGAHLSIFEGSDTMEGAQHIIKHYGDWGPGLCVSYSVAASEHSTMTSWGRDGEAAACENMIDQFGKADSVFSVVSDSYDIYNCTDNIFGGVLKEKVKALEDMNSTLVVRPDSGPLMEVAIEVCELLMEKFGFTINSKGYRCLPKYLKVLQGDGLNKDTLDKLCGEITLNGLSLSNFVFGMGGGLLQDVNRDTYGFAMKASATKINDQWEDCYKDPIHGGKTSKRGILALHKDADGKFFTARAGEHPDKEDFLKLRYRDGIHYNFTTFAEVRARAAL